LILQTKILFLSIAILVFSSCVTERVEKTHNKLDGEEYLRKEIAKVVERLPYDKDIDLYNDQQLLVTFGDYAAEPMIDCLKHSNQDVRSSAIYVLGQIECLDAVDDITKLLDDDNKFVRYEAARTLLKLGIYNSIPTLIDGLDDDSVHIRNQCYGALNRKTGETFNYSVKAERVERLKAIRQWELWWDVQKDNKYKESRTAVK